MLADLRLTCLICLEGQVRSYAKASIKALTSLSRAFPNTICGLWLARTQLNRDLNEIDDPSSSGDFVVSPL